MKPIEFVEKMAAWLERAANQADAQESQNRGRFDSLADACRADAKNYRAMLKDAKDILNSKKP